MSFKEAAKGTKAPKSVLAQMVLLEVQYYGTDKKLHQGQMMVHRDLAGDVKEIFSKMLAEKFAVHKAVPMSAYGWDDNKAMADNNSSAFCYRNIAGTDELSWHALGRAIDINPKFNPWIHKDGKCCPPDGKYDVKRSGTLCEGGVISKLFLKKGFIWGKDFAKYEDIHHFEKWLTPHPNPLPQGEREFLKPTVGLVLDEADDFAGWNYVKALVDCGLNVKFITYEKAEKQMSDVSGLLLPGGFFGFPAKWYQKKVDAKESKRCKAYVAAYKYAQKRKMPILGICAGMQVMACLNGAKLFNDIKKECPDVKEEHRDAKEKAKAHLVKIEKKSLLYKILGKEKIWVNSNHSESVVPSSFAAPAVSGEGIVEAIELGGFALGLQWHPEYMYAVDGDKNSKKIFKAFAEVIRQEL